MDIYEILPFPKDIVECIIGKMDIDSRRVFGIFRRLPKERYIPFEGLTFPLCVNPHWSILRLEFNKHYLTQFGRCYCKYTRVRRYDNDFSIEYVYQCEGEDPYNSHSSYIPYNSYHCIWSHDGIKWHKDRN